MAEQSISHYQVLEKIGEGGMGAVHKAHDTHLDRLVALKFLPSDKVLDPERRKRLVREARAASALNHPNIITVHDVAVEDGVHFIVMEYIAGRTLHEAIGGRGLPLREALDYAIQIADALGAAHSAGIIHRDLKPANVMLTNQGNIKVLDFGLAKQTEPATLPSAAAETATASQALSLSKNGMLLGTTPYMSPEQLQGTRLDNRSDIFAFGALLYEMTTGQRAFLAESLLSTVAAILNEEPRAIGDLVKNLPHALDRIIVRCLKKSPLQRYQHIGDVKIALEDIRDDLNAGRFTAQSSQSYSPRHRVFTLGTWIAIATLVTLIIAAGLAIWLRPPVAPTAPVLSAVPLTTYPGVEAYPSLSPDGNQVAFTWNGDRQDNFDIYVKLVGPGAPIRLTTDPAEDTSPVWSPDGRWIAFVRVLPKERGILMLVPALGGAERELGEIAISSFITMGPLGSAAAWSTDSSSLIVTDKPSPTEAGGLFAFSVATGEQRRLTTLPSNAWMDVGPALSPNARNLVFTRFVNFGLSDLHVLPLGDDLRPTAEPKRLTYLNRFSVAPAWTPDGREIIFSSGAMTAGPVNLFTIDLSAAGDGKNAPRPLASLGQDASLPSISHPPGKGRPRLVYMRSHFDSGVWRAELVRQDAKADSAQPKTTPFILSTQPEYLPQYSPDGQKVAFVSHSSGAGEIWVCDKDGASLVQLTSGGWNETGNPRWSPDGTQIAFQARQEGPGDIFTIASRGGVPKRVVDDPSDEWGATWSRDGRWLYFGSNRSGRHEIWKVPISGGAAVQVTRDGAHGALVSPDGRFVYYTHGSELWRTPTDGGHATRVLASLSDWSRFAITAEGIYFIPRPLGRTAADFTIDYVRFADEKIQTFARLEKPPFIGMTVSPDARWLLYTQIDQAGTDLVLVEGFR